MYDFHYHRPKSLADAVSLLKGKDEARPMSGGMTLIPTLKQRLAKPSDVVDLGGSALVARDALGEGGAERDENVFPVRPKVAVTIASPVRAACETIAPA